MTGFLPSAPVRLALAGAAGLAAWARLAIALAEAHAGRLGPLTAYGFAVVFPLVLIGLCLSLGPTRTREGVLIRIATIAQLVLVIAVARYALPLLFGLPVAFLLVELFATRLPRHLRDPVEGWLVTC